MIDDYQAVKPWWANYVWKLRSSVLFLEEVERGVSGRAATFSSRIGLSQTFETPTDHRLWTPSAIDNTIEICTDETREDLIFKSAPEWATVVVEWKRGDGASKRVIYLETDEKGVSGRLLSIDSSSSLEEAKENYGETSPYHIWHMNSNQSQVVARRENRKATEEELEILSDLGLIEYVEDYYRAPAWDDLEETTLHVTVVKESGEVLFDNENDATTRKDVAHVSEFARVCSQAYKAMGFKNELTMSFKMGDTEENFTYKVFP